MPVIAGQAWFSVDGEPLFAWAGFCRNTELWGPYYAGMTTDNNDAVKQFNPRMPVLHNADEWERWLTCGIPASKTSLGFNFAPTRPSGCESGPPMRVGFRAMPRQCERPSRRSCRVRSLRQRPEPLLDDVGDLFHALLRITHELRAGEANDNDAVSDHQALAGPHKKGEIL